jgi:2-polyprenyl-3-methyl-5-hydroxy-6-metoxy-1,4-benzoquinol methylase
MAHQVEQGLFSPFLQRARLSAAKPYLRGRVLDIGCGNGALADFVSAECYLGVDRDAGALTAARAKHAGHSFVVNLPAHGSFDTVVGLAVIEHLNEPGTALKKWSRLLAPNGRILLTTPHRRFRLAHELGSRLGLFSWEAADEHEEMFDRDSLSAVAQEAGLGVERYVRFLGGANQLFLLAPRVS